MQKSKIFQVLRPPTNSNTSPDPLKQPESSSSQPMFEDLILSRDLILQKFPHPYVYHDRRRKKFLFSLKFENKSYRKHFRCQTIREFRNELSSIHDWLSTFGITLTCNCSDAKQIDLEKQMLFKIKNEIQQIQINDQTIQKFLSKKLKRHRPSEYSDQLPEELKKYLDVCANIEAWQFQLFKKTRKFFFDECQTTDSTSKK
jgi:hypothetical protein